MISVLLNLLNSEKLQFVRYFSSPTFQHVLLEVNHMQDSRMSNPFQIAASKDCTFFFSFFLFFFQPIRCFQKKSTNHLTRNFFDIFHSSSRSLSQKKKTLEVAKKKKSEKFLVTALAKTPTYRPVLQKVPYMS